LRGPHYLLSTLNEAFRPFSLNYRAENHAPAHQLPSPRSNEQFELDEKELLGSAAYQHLEEYNREDGAVAGVRQAAWYTQPIEPYSADQVTQLTHIIANASTSYQQGGTVGSIDWNQVLTNAATVLSPAQTDGLNIPAMGGVMDRLMKTYKNQQPDK